MFRGALLRMTVTGMDKDTDPHGRSFSSSQPSLNWRAHLLDILPVPEPQSCLARMRGWRSPKAFVEARRGYAPRYEQTGILFASSESGSLQAGAANRAGESGERADAGRTPAQSSL